MKTENPSIKKIVVCFLILCFYPLYSNAQTKYRNSRGIKKSLQQLPPPSINSDYSRPIYDAKGRLIMENFWGCAGQTCIKRIEYHYNGQSQLTQQVLFYTGTKSPKDEAKLRCVTHFFYDNHGKLIKTITELNQRSKNRGIVKTIQYQLKHKKYGENGQKPNKLYISFQDVVRQQLDSKRHPLFIRRR